MIEFLSALHRANALLIEGILARTLSVEQREAAKLRQHRIELWLIQNGVLNVP